MAALKKATVYGAESFGALKMDLFVLGGCKQTGVSENWDAS